MSPPRRRLARCAPLGGLLLALPLPALGADALQADALGQGGTTRADLDGVSSVVDAPALLALRPRYDVQAGGGLGPDKERLLQAAAMDSRTGPVALGLTAVRKTHTPSTLSKDLPGWQIPGDDTSNPHTELLLGGALAGAWFDRHLGVGVGVFYAGETSRYTEDEHHVEATASVAGRIGEVLTMGVSGQNLVPGGPEWLPLSVGGGARADVQDVFGVAVDVVADLESGDSGPTLLLGAGLDGVIAEALVLRGGYRLNQLDDVGSLTFGLGATGANGGLDYAMEVGVHGSGSLGLAGSRHLLALRIRL